MSIDSHLNYNNYKIWVFLIMLQIYGNNNIDIDTNINTNTNNINTNTSALQATSGNVNSAVERLLSGI